MKKLELLKSLEETTAAELSKQEMIEMNGGVINWTVGGWGLYWSGGLDGIKGNTVFMVGYHY